MKNSASVAVPKGITVLQSSGWQCELSKKLRDKVISDLESGQVIYLPSLAFEFSKGEKKLFEYDYSGLQAKNVSYIPHSQKLKGTKGPDELEQLLSAMMARYAKCTAELIASLFPHYSTNIQQARTSFRPIEIVGRKNSYRKDDTLLHVDAFPSSPNQGRRILRVFSNINPDGQARVWRFGEPFAELAQKFVPRISSPIPGAHVLFELLKITKARRSHYDHIMLNLHNKMKADATYQQKVQQCKFAFPPGGTWIVLTDQVSHAAMSGQHLLEQTFHLPVDAMLEPAKSPLRVLERLLDKKLA